MKKESRETLHLVLGGVGAATGVIGVGYLLLSSRKASASEQAPERTPQTAATPPRAPFKKPAAVSTSTLPGKDTEAIGRIITSEVGDKDLSEAIAVAYTAVNRARLHGVTVFELVTLDGQYGRQGDEHGPFSAARAASPRALRVAAWVLSHPQGLARDADAAAEVVALDPKITGEEGAQAARFLESTAGEDPARGAVAFWEPALQDELLARGIVYRSGGGDITDKTPAGKHAELWKYRKYQHTAAAIRASWEAGGQRVVLTVGREEFLTDPSAHPRSRTQTPEATVPSSPTPAPSSPGPLVRPLDGGPRRVTPAGGWHAPRWVAKGGKNTTGADPKDGTPIDHYHNALDLVATPGEAVRAVGAGKLVSFAPGYCQTGVKLVLDGYAATSVVYCDLGKATKKPGDRVAAGDEVGRVGDRGFVHVSVRVGAQWVNPSTFLPLFTA